MGSSVRPRSKHLNEGKRGRLGQDLVSFLLRRSCLFSHVLIVDLVQRNKRFLDGLGRAPPEDVMRTAGLVVGSWEEKYRN